MARQQLEVALNKGASQRPAHICDDILVKELQMGTLVCADAAVGAAGGCSSFDIIPVSWDVV